MPNFLSVIRDIMRQLPDIELITWKCANYRWPDCPIDQNMLRFNFGSKAEVRNSGEELKAVFEELRNILAPPSLYHSLTKRSVIARIKENYGEYRLGIVPDLGSGLLNLAFTKQYVSCPLPLTIMGFSKKSTGTSFKGGGLFSAPAQEFRRLSKLAELEQKYLPEIEDYHQNVGQWRLLLEWQDYFASKGLQLSFNNPLMLKYCIDHLYGLPMDSREKSAATLLAYAEKQGADMPSYTARAKFAMAQTSLTVPGFRKVSEDHVSVSVNLSATPIKSTSAVAGLIRGFYTS
ncbi:MAG: hypothetical protein K2P94_06495, partial [Rhodospirillaceae bacterium]|nr:hypothetical protein [Rhodospirillaceae bacterium]